MKGIIKKFMPDGYGFIASVEGDIYFNVRALSLRGCEVEFDLATNASGACWARNLQFLPNDGSCVAPASSGRPIGVVKLFKCGWGFIRRDGEDDLFVHYSGIAGTGFRQLDVGDVVEFTIAEGERGARAADVVVVKSTIPTRIADEMPRPYFRPKASGRTEQQFIQTNLEPAPTELVDPPLAPLAPSPVATGPDLPPLSISDRAACLRINTRVYPAEKTKKVKSEEKEQRDKKKKKRPK